MLLEISALELSFTEKAERAEGWNSGDAQPQPSRFSKPQDTVPRTEGSSPQTPGFPDFTLPNDAGGLTSRATLLSDGFCVVLLERGSWCPYGTLFLLEMAKVQAEIDALGGQIAAILPDVQRHTHALRHGLALPFPILSDIDLELARGLGPVRELSAATLEAFAADGIDLRAIQACAQVALPTPALYVLGSDGRIIWHFSDPDPSLRPNTSALLDALNQGRL